MTPRPIELPADPSAPDGETPEQTLDRAMALHRAGRLPEAEVAYGEALAQLLPAVPTAGQPAHPKRRDALHLQGILYQQLQRPEAAVPCLEESLALGPDARTAFSLGLALHQCQRLPEAEAAYREATRLDPQFADTYNNLGLVLREQGKRELAIGAYLRGIELRPENPFAYNNLGITLLENGQPREAEIAYRAALELDPGYAVAHNNLGVVLKDGGRREEAEAAYRAALACKPDYPEAHNNLGVVCKETERYQEALTAYRAALHLRPDYPEAHNNLGVVLKELGQDEAAEAAYLRALDLRPVYPDARLNLALLRLTQGRYREAWPEHEARYDQRRPRPAAKWPPLTTPFWQGEPLAGKRLLIWPEQGFGDAIHFVRYAALLKRQGVAEVHLVCQTALAPLLATAPGVDRVCEDPRDFPDHDFWTFPMCLPYHLGTTLENLPATLPYLFSLPERRARWAEPLGQGEPQGLRIGIVWKGNPTHGNDRQRSLPHLRTLAPLFALPGITWVSLQKGAGENELDELSPGERPPGGILPLGPTMADFADTAAIIDQLDLLITVDTAAAHVAGALGKPCWLLLAYHGLDWRWLREGESSPWYPGVMRLFRAPAPQVEGEGALETPWAEPLAAVSQALDTLVRPARTMA